MPIIPLKSKNHVSNDIYRARTYKHGLVNNRKEADQCYLFSWTKNHRPMADNLRTSKRGTYRKILSHNLVLDNASNQIDLIFFTKIITQL